MKPAVTRRASSKEIEVTSSSGAWLATLTDGAYTVRLAGPSRTFSEVGASDHVTHAIWVRTLAQPFAGQIDHDWIKAALTANTTGNPDVLAIAMQYINGAPPIADGDLVIAGAARYGPPGKDKDGRIRPQEGADFNDYLGIPWTYPDTLDQPEVEQFRCLDCSGYMRIVWGYREKLPLGHSLTQEQATLPRRAWQICEAEMGVEVIPNKRVQVTDFSPLAVGDLVFFDGDAKDGPRIDHVGMYLGLDASRHHRFVSSRKTADGPTLADLGGKSIMDGNIEHYAKAFRAVRRL